MTESICSTIPRSTSWCGCVTRSGEAIHLRPRTYEVLAYLVENRGHLISKDKLIEDVWQSRGVTDGSGKCIEELRGALAKGQSSTFATC